ncbi:MAG: endonuclease III [Bacteroidales bacterium]|nr:endonuclease III [Bacteroidales bacterium]
MKKTERFKRFISYFSENQPVAETELVYESPYELIVAVILSAQCTDKRVNLITPGFFSRFPAVEDLAAAGQDEVFELIKSCSYPNNKAKHLRGMAEMIVSRFGGVVPSTREELTMLPGVGRKTANVIASVVWNSPVIAVDTHVFRVARRLGLTPGARNPLEVEIRLTREIPEGVRPRAHHWLLLHGRYICTARRPQCQACGLKSWCAWYASHGEKIS